MSIQVRTTNITGGTIKSVSSPHGSFVETVTAPSVTASTITVDNVNVVQADREISNAGTTYSEIITLDNATNRIRMITFESTGTGTIDLLQLTTTGGTLRYDLKTALGGTVELGKQYSIEPTYGSGSGQMSADDIEQFRFSLTNNTSTTPIPQTIEVKLVLYFNDA